MKEIVNENYNYNYLIYKVIEKFPKYIKLNEELVKMFKINQYQNGEKYFTLITLVPIYEYFEKLCWEEIKKNVLLDYQIELNDKIKEHILKYFDENKNKKDLIFSKKDFASAIRKLISRYLVSLRGDVEIDPKMALNLQIIRGDLWDKKIIENDLFESEIKKICIDEIYVNNCMALYNLIGEVEKDNDELLKNKKIQDNNIKIIENNILEINTNSNQIIQNDNIEETKDNDESSENEEIEETEREEF